MRLITWNIQWGRGNDGRVDLARIVDAARRLSDFDVLCLQEVADGFPELPGSDGSDQFAALATLLPGYTAIDGVATDTPSPGGGRRRFGNAILSRLPVRQVFRHLLPWPADPAVRSMQRIALEATIESPGGPLRVTTTHLEYYSSIQRSAQVERLRELQREAVAQARSPRPGDASEAAFTHVPRGEASLVCGDFNCRPDSPEHARMTSPIDSATPHYVDAWELARPGRPHPPTAGLYDRVQWSDGPQAFDFVFVSTDLAPRVLDLRIDASADASDHQPLLIELA